MRVLAGMALLMLGCGGGDFVPRVDQAMVVAEDAGQTGAGGVEPAATGGAAGGAVGSGGAPGLASAGGAGGASARATCAVDTDCRPGWHCGETGPKSGKLACAKPCHIAQSQSDPTGCGEADSPFPAIQCVAFVGLSIVDNCLAIQAGAARYCADRVVEQSGCPF